MRVCFADVSVVDAHPNVCFDLTPGNEMIANFIRNCDAALDFFIRYQDQLVYDTDIATWGFVREGGMDHALGTAWAVRMCLEAAGVLEPPEALAHWREPDLGGSVVSRWTWMCWRRSFVRVSSVSMAPNRLG